MLQDLTLWNQHTFQPESFLSGINLQFYVIGYFTEEETFYHNRGNCGSGMVKRADYIGWLYVNAGHNSYYSVWHGPSHYVGMARLTRRTYLPSSVA